MRKLLQIRRTARIVRWACEEFSITDDAAFFDFYNCPDKLGGMCAIASFALREQLKIAHGIEADIIHGTFASCGGHCWLTVDDNYLIDITATQFNYYYTILTNRADDWGVFNKVFMTTVDKANYHVPLYGVQYKYDNFKM